MPPLPPAGPDAPDRLPSRRDRHAATRTLASLVVSLLVVNGAFLLWPDLDLGPDVVRQPPPREMVTMQMIEPTRQPPPPANLPPTPPPPAESALPPVEVPDERIIQELELTLPAPPPEPPRPVRRPAPARPAPPAPPGPPPPVPSTPPPPSDRIVERPDRSPSLSGQALPVYPRDASVRGFRGSARVKVLVNQGGRVTDAEIVERVVFDRGRETPTATFPPEFDAAILEAARRHVFRPARDGGERVRAYAFISIALDPPG